MLKDSTQLKYKSLPLHGADIYTIQWFATCVLIGDAIIWMPETISSKYGYLR